MLRTYTFKPKYLRLLGVLIMLLVPPLLFDYVQQAAHAMPVQPGFNHFLRTHTDDSAYDDNADLPGMKAAQEQYDNRAYPHTAIDYERVLTTYNAFQSLTKKPAGVGKWQQIGPSTTTAPAATTYTGHTTTISGRVTAITVANSCTIRFCRIWLGAAGGGIWTTNQGLSTTPTWNSASNGLASNAIGSIILDPNDISGKTLYAGTGEMNGSSDSEAGVGLYRSVNYGNSWTLLPGSIPVAKDRSIGAIAIDPTNPRHIYIGTDVARHGSSASNGGRFTPPTAPVIGLYESQDGGATFKLIFSRATDTVDPTAPNGFDFFRGGITKIQIDHTGLASNQPWEVYFSVFDYGLYRLVNGSFEQVFASAGQGNIQTSSSARTEFALAPNGKQLRIYLGDTDGTTADLYRIDNAYVSASTLTDGTNNPGWTRLSSSDPGSLGYAAYNFCSNGQCNYDMWVASPAGHPDTVWIGGSMQYNEIFSTNPPSNGRAIQRSTDAGIHFTDMTNDMQTPPVGMHPDQHAVAFASSNPDIAFLGSDGGIVRTSGTFADGSADCAKRNLTGTDLQDCTAWLSQIPTQIYSLNAGLATLQFQSITINPKAPLTDIIGGTQDNGTLSYMGKPNWTMSVAGDGGQSLIDAGNPNIRMHTYYGPAIDVNFNSSAPQNWDYISDPLTASKEAASFYIPLINDPLVSGTMFTGLEHVWRTQDSGGTQAYLDKNCNEMLPTFPNPGTCGDWIPLGGTNGPTLIGNTFGQDKSGSYIVALQRAATNNSTLWAATRRGRLFISLNANAAADSVTFTRIDTAAQPERFISGIAVDPHNPLHAFVTFSGYNAYTPTTPGHVFDVIYDPATGKATWKDISYDLGDTPITGIAYDSIKGNLFVSSDYGVALLVAGNHLWHPAAPGMPPVAVYNLAISSTGRVLYAATHGRGAWRLNLGK